MSIRRAPKQRLRLLPGSVPMKDWCVELSCCCVKAYDPDPDDRESITWTAASASHRGSKLPSWPTQA